MDAVLRFLDDHHGLAWLGVLLAIPALASNADLSKWWTILGLISLGLMLGLLLVAFVSRKKSDVTCIECDQTFNLSGPRGRSADCAERLLLKARRQFKNTVIASLQYDGSLSDETFEYRNHGKTYDKDGPWTVLNPNQIFSAPSGLDEAERLFWPPAPIAKGELFEIRRKYRHEDSFPNDTEAVGKRVLFPIRRLSFEVVFEGVEIDSLHGITYSQRQPVAGSHTSIVPSQDTSGNIKVEWLVDDAKTEHTYRLAWRWLDANNS